MVSATSFDVATLSPAALSDDGGRRLEALLLVTPNLAQAVTEVVAQGAAVMPAGGLTSAIGSFDFPPEAGIPFPVVVAIRPKGVLKPEVVAEHTPPEALQAHQMSMMPGTGLVAVGAGLTLAQVNAVLMPEAQVLTDLTSVASAFVGGVIATGAMGPLRLRPSGVLEAVVVADGTAVRTLRGDEIAGVEGLQGWTGMVTAAVFRTYRLPGSEFGLVLPVQGNDVDTVAGLLVSLEPWTRLVLPAPGEKLGEERSLVINGIELVSRESLAAFVAEAPEPARTKAQGLLQSCEYAGADSLACITGWSESSVDEVLYSLLDPETETIGGVMIDFGVGFSSGIEMETFRAIREGAPDLARTRARVKPPGKLKPWSTSTDINIVATPEVGAIANILAAYADYRAAILALGKEMAEVGVQVELATYGHLSPRGIDPHHRVTLFADEGNEAALAGAKQAVLAGKRALIRDLLHAAERGSGLITGGEKGVPSLVEIARAAGGENRLPPNLRKALAAAQEAVALANKSFSFRALKELR